MSRLTHYHTIVFDVGGKRRVCGFDTDAWRRKEEGVVKPVAPTAREACH